MENKKNNTFKKYYLLSVLGVLRRTESLVRDAGAARARCLERKRAGRQNPCRR